MEIQSQINQISILIAQIQNHNTKLTVAKNWMLTHNNDPQLTPIISKLSVVSFHILDILLSYKELTGIEIAKLLGFTRGGVCRATPKLKNEKLITTVHHTNNKKNIYYQLTDKGEKLGYLHKKMHEELYKNIQNKILEKFSIKELDIIIKFLTYIKNYEKNLKSID